MAETDAEFYRRKKSSVVVRHVSGDDIVAMIEIVSPGNKSSRRTFEAFVQKAFDLLESRIHLLIIDPFPRGPETRKGSTPRSGRRPRHSRSSCPPTSHSPWSLTSAA